MRRALAVLILALAVPAVALAGSDREILSVRYDAPTTRYAHGVLGDAVEWGALVLKVDTCPACALLKAKTIRITLPDTRVFEDLEPRLVDLDNDGRPEVVVVESDVRLGAALAVYDESGKIAQTPHIGRTNRWLAPLGAADLDGDGKVELAYIDRPHLAKTLRIWRFDGGKLVHLADKPGLTNHKIGEDFISGGIRDCGTGPEIVTASGDWARVMVTTYRGGKVASRDAGPFKGSKSLSDAVACK
ncbi:FG-GAP repeat domain-containing protein [Shimia aestuarii]|uniref:Repeat domain-containing protein n=1 Tax=Shimia aestuarii TaxID=254406 RepID=A0A1I4IH00_9RHOB|nr:VCBS repeat-containing protein [Shimia aestuarii]SFL53283.1 Repeat domain-containing protein [Shimia aestuarii]